MLKAVVEFRRRFMELRDKGSTVEEASEAALAQVEKKYGAGADWSRIFELILTFLALFMK